VAPQPAWEIVLVLMLVLTLAMSACTVVPPVAATPGPTATATVIASAIPPTSTPTPAPATPTSTLAPTATIAPATSTPTPTAAPTLSTDSLVQTVLSGLPQGAFEGVAVLPLSVPAGGQPLWAVYSYGLLNFDLQPPPSHFVAIYTQEQGQWKQLARQEFALDDQTVAAPDYVDKNGLTQAPIEPGHIWLALEGGVGAHGGTFDLLSFAGNTLQVEVSGTADSPGLGSIQDVNGDGVPDVMLDVSDRYIFCYACGVAKAQFQVYAWDQANGRMTEMQIQPMLMGQSGHPGRILTNQAVSLAEAGLWKDALSVMTQAKEASANIQPPFTNYTVDWDYGLIKLYADALAQNAQDGGYPLLTKVFYGDYAAAVDLMRPYAVSQIFTPSTPLVIGTVAETWVPELTMNITSTATAALAVEPNLAPAYFLRGWAEYLADPTSGLAAAKADVDKAAALAPDDPLFTQAAAYLAGSQKPPATPTPEVARMQFAAGATSATLSGDLAAGAEGEYVLRALQGQRMMVDVYSPQSDVVLGITGADGQALLRQSARQTTWAGYLPATQNYTIRVYSTGGSTPYTLDVIIPERITFAPGAISATLQGKLAANQIHEYLLRALAGQTMTVTITSPDNDVLLEIYGIDDGQPLVRVPMGQTAWTGKLPGTQDYDIKAVSVGGATAYTLVVEVK